MILLAVDTSTPRAALAIGLPDGSTRSTTPDPRARHGRALLGDLHRLLEAQGLAPIDLDALAVGLGPGSYTGLRVGVTALKTLAYALGRPLIGLDSLAAIASNAPAGDLSVSVIADAQRGDLYVGEFSREAPGRPFQRDSPTRIVAEATWRAGLRAGTLAIGPAIGRLREIPGSSPPPDDPMHFPDPGRLLELARAALAEGRTVEPWFLEPIYLRRSAAEDLWEAKSDRAAPNPEPVAPP